MTKILSKLFIVCILYNCSNKSRTPIMIDGKINHDEWLDANEVAIDSLNRIYAKSDDQYYYLAIKSLLPKPLYADIFIAESISIKNIHASSQLGDRVLMDTIWTDDEPRTKWGYNTGWMANTVKFDREKIQIITRENPEINPYVTAFIPYDGMEFQFSKRHFKLDGAKFRIEIRNMIGPDGFKTVVFPQDSKRKKVNSWTTIEFN